MIQKVINFLYRNPRAKFKIHQRFGGYLAYRQMMKSKAKMEIQSKLLAPISSYSDGLPIYFLTGKKYLYQTLFCIHSLVKCSDTKFRFTLVDDGSFDEELYLQINKQLPNSIIVSKKTIEDNLSKNLPAHLYPYLHYKRKVYPHIKKLTDIHTISDNPVKLVLDSDMLFWNEPTELINWLRNPMGCLYMLDCDESYGYDNALMTELCGFDVPKLMNVGTFGVNSNIIDWQKIEDWSKTLEEKEGTSYFLEQALSAMLIANEPKTILNDQQYIVNPDEESISWNEVKLHHYVDLSKKYYFNKAWKKLTHAEKTI